MRLKDDSSWNDVKEEKLLRNVLLMRKSLNEKEKKATSDEDQITLDFINNYSRWVDHETREEVWKGNEKGINKSLDQIHSKSLYPASKPSYKDSLLNHLYSSRYPEKYKPSCRSPSRQGTSKNIDHLTAFVTNLHVSCQPVILHNLTT